MPKISINIVTWNSEKFIETCLINVFSQTIQPDQIQVIDNNSSDGTREILKKYRNKIQMHLLNENIGFAGGHNWGISSSIGDYILVLNPDVILEPYYILHSSNALKNYPEVGIIQGKLIRIEELAWVRKSNIIDSIGLNMSKSRRFVLQGSGEIDNGQFDNEVNVFGADGAAPMFRKKTLDDLRVNDEYFDADFHSHKEDQDISWRAQLLGWKIRYVPLARAYHVRSFRPSSTQHRKNQPMFVKKNAVRNQLLMQIKNDQLFDFLKDFIHIFIYQLKIFMYLIIFERASLYAYIELIRLLPKMIKKRKIIMKKIKMKANSA